VPAAIVAFSPGLDYTGTGKNMDTKAGIDPLFTRESLLHTGTMYLAGQNPNQPLLTPAVHADLTGFPPILLQVGTNELLLDNSVRLAERARDADVDVILDITAGGRTCSRSSSERSTRRITHSAEQPCSSPSTWRASGRTRLEAVPVTTSACPPEPIWNRRRRMHVGCATLEEQRQCVRREPVTRPGT
jgi:acetyl esterase/lipase